MRDLDWVWDHAVYLGVVLSAAMVGFWAGYMDRQLACISVLKGLFVP